MSPVRGPGVLPAPWRPHARAMPSRSRDVRLWV